MSEPESSDGQQAKSTTEPEIVAEPEPTPEPIAEPEPTPEPIAEQGRAQRSVEQKKTTEKIPDY